MWELHFCVLWGMVWRTMWKLIVICFVFYCGHYEMSRILRQTAVFWVKGQLDINLRRILKYLKRKSQKLKKSRRVFAEIERFRIKHSWIMRFKQILVRLFFTIRQRRDNSVENLKEFGDKMVKSGNLAFFLLRMLIFYTEVARIVL